MGGGRSMNMMPDPNLIMNRGQAIQNNAAQGKTLIMEENKNELLGIISRNANQMQPKRHTIMNMQGGGNTGQKAP